MPEEPRTGVLHLPVRAIRATLGRPGTHGVVVLATLIALLGGWFGAGVASRIGLEFATPLPHGAEAERLRQTVLPGVPITGDGAAPTWTFSDDGEHVVYGAAKYSAGPPGVTLDVLDGAPNRLTAAGWRIQDVPAGESPLARASRDDLILDVTAEGFTVTRTTPGWLWRFALTGAAAGALIGWLITGWAGRRGSYPGQRGESK